MASITQGKQRIMLKPNLTSDEPKATTKPAVIGTLARLLQSAGKEVWIGEDSTAASGITILGVQYTTRRDCRRRSDPSSTFACSFAGGR